MSAAYEISAAQPWSSSSWFRVAYGIFVVVFVLSVHVQVLRARRSGSRRLPFTPKMAWVYLATVGWILMLTVTAGLTGPRQADEFPGPLFGVIFGISAGAVFSLFTIGLKLSKRLDATGSDQPAGSLVGWWLLMRLAMGAGVYDAVRVIRHPA